MPIKGLTDELSFDPKRALPLLGRIYKGDEKPEAGNRPGRDLDHFRVEFESEYSDLADTWNDLYGDEPTRFERVFFTMPKAYQAFESWNEEWNASTLLHRCDGEHQIMRYDVETNMMLKNKVGCEIKCGCKPTGRMTIFMPDFVEATGGVLGVFMLTTHSIHDLITIHNRLTAFERSSGSLTGIPFTLGRKPREISAPMKVKGENVRRRITKNLLYIEPDVSYVRENLLPALTAMPALPSGNGDSVSDTRLRLGNGGTRRIGGDSSVTILGIDATSQTAPMAERWWHDPDSENVFLNNSLEEGADTINLNGPYGSKAEAEAAKTTFTAPAEQSTTPPAELPALTPEQAADKAFDEIPSMNEGKPSTLDSDEGYKPYTFDRVRLADKPGGKGFMYILTQLRRGDNPTLFEGKLLRDVGLPVDAWKADGKGIYVLPGTYTALATFDKQKQAWHVKRVDAPANAQNAPELPANAAEIPF